jgi:hypothetical protein
MTHTFLVTVTIDEDEDLSEVADEIYDRVAPNFGDDTTVVPWSPHGETLPPEL